MRNVFVVGDSISIHYGPYLEEALQPGFAYDRKRGTEEALKDLNNPTGANGGDSSMVLDYLEGLRERQVRFDILLVNCGLHDIKTDPVTGSKQVSPEQYEVNIRRICEVADEMARQLIWIRTTPLIDEVHNRINTSFYRFNRDVLQYNGIADQVMKERTVPMIDLYAFTLSLGSDTYIDHVHFNEEARKEQAVYIQERLEAILGPDCPQS